jgi:hypothetical protein
MNEDLRVANAVVAHLQRTDLEPVLFSGAGVSMRAGLPDWKGLLTALAEGVRFKSPLHATLITECIAQNKLPKAADLWAFVDEVSLGDKYDTLKNALSNYDSKPLKDIASLPFRSCLTTNFDRSILDAFAVARGTAPRDYRLGDKSLAEVVWEKQFYVARLHGCVESPEEIVLSGTQFERLLQDQVYVDLLTRTFTNKAVLFLGFSFYDPAIRHVLNLIDKKYGPSPQGRHTALIPRGFNEFLQKANRLNIDVVEYDPANRHAALWDGISKAAATIKNTNTKAKTEKGPVSLLRPMKKYLAACYARAQISSSTVSLSEVVLEGVVSAVIQAVAPKGIPFHELCDAIRNSIGVRGDDVDEPILAALKALIDGKLIRRQRTKGEKGYKYSWINAIEPCSGLDAAIEKLVMNVLDRLYVQEGWKPKDSAVKDILGQFMMNAVQHRGWDLGAAFAAGRPPDGVDVPQILVESGAARLSALDRERLVRSLDSMFLRPTADEAELLGELGRVSFALELAFQAPRSTLFHRATLPKRIYFDTNVVMPSIIKGHPNQKIYNTAIRRMKEVSAASGVTTQFIVLQGYLNEVMSHLRAALDAAAKSGENFDAAARADVLFHGATSVNVFIGAYVRHLDGGGVSGFSEFVNRVAPFKTESELSRSLTSQGFLVVNQIKDPSYAKLYAMLERANARKLVDGKEPILLEHDALQLRILGQDATKGDRSVFVTADRRLCEDVTDPEFVHLRDSMISHIGLLQLVDLLIGMKVDKREVGALLWSSTVSDKTQKLRSYLVAEALEQHDAAMAMEMHHMVEVHAEKFVKELDRAGLDLDSQSPKKRVEAFSTLRILEKGFFSGMRAAIEKEERQRN